MYLFSRPHRLLDDIATRSGSGHDQRTHSKRGESDSRSDSHAFKKEHAEDDWSNQANSSSNIGSGERRRIREAVDCRIKLFQRYLLPLLNSKQENFSLNELLNWADDHISKLVFVLQLLFEMILVVGQNEGAACLIAYFFEELHQFAAESVASEVVSDIVRKVLGDADF